MSKNDYKTLYMKQGQKKKIHFKIVYRVTVTRAHDNITYFSNLPFVQAILEVN